MEGVCPACTAPLNAPPSQEPSRNRPRRRRVTGSSCRSRSPTRLLSRLHLGYISATSRVYITGPARPPGRRRSSARLCGARLGQQEAGRAREAARQRAAKGRVRSGCRRGHVDRGGLDGRFEVRSRREERLFTRGGVSRLLSWRPRRASLRPGTRRRWRRRPGRPTSSPPTISRQRRPEGGPGLPVEGRPLAPFQTSTPRLCDSCRGREGGESSESGTHVH